MFAFIITGLLSASVLFAASAASAGVLVSCYCEQASIEGRSYVNYKIKAYSLQNGEEMWNHNVKQELYGSMETCKQTWELTCPVRQF